VIDMVSPRSVAADIVFFRRRDGAALVASRRNDQSPDLKLVEHENIPGGLLGHLGQKRDQHI
jgi:hypothetical protein